MPHISNEPSETDSDFTLYEVDIRNSQPLVIGFLASKYWIAKGCAVPMDVVRWIDVCEHGCLYEELADLANKDANCTHYDREWVKANLMTAHYAEQHIVDSCFSLLTWSDGGFQVSISSLLVAHAEDRRRAPGFVV